MNAYSTPNETSHPQSTPPILTTGNPINVPAVLGATAPVPRAGQTSQQSATLPQAAAHALWAGGSKPRNDRGPQIPAADFVPSHRRSELRLDAAWQGLAAILVDIAANPDPPADGRQVATQDVPRRAGTRRVQA
ncbi:MAG: hypothetical protein M0Z94_02505 [Dehalococcoidales bacterium]|nr:hypothetical protein [Dehalococcoidales bacterium]